MQRDDVRALQQLVERCVREAKPLGEERLLPQIVRQHLHPKAAADPDDVQPEVANV